MLTSNAPKPPASIPDNVCASQCNVCGRKWFEGTVTMVHCSCQMLRVCPDCACKMSELEVMEHNMQDCNAKLCEGCEDVAVSSSQKLCDECEEPIVNR